MIETDLIKSKLPDVGTTIFSVMSKMAADCGAINLSQGFPDFPIDPRLSELVYKNMQKGNNQYAPMQGVPDLREAIARKIKRTYNQEYNPDMEITVTAGATQGIYTTISALVSEGDEVIVFTPAYDCYMPPIKLNQGTARHYQLKAPDYKVDWQEFRKLVNPRTKLIILNTPHNPTGTILEEEDMLELEEIITNSNAFLLSDEVYEHITFDGKAHASAARFPKLASRSLIVASFGKTFHATGWKMGYIYGPEYLMKEFRKVHQYLVFSVNTPAQYALAEYLEAPENYENISPMYERKRDLFLKALEGSRFKAIPSSGTYFQLLDFSAISNDKEVGFAEKLTKEHGVAAIPVSVFYENKREQQVLRFCFAKDDDTLLAAAKKLSEL
ncbi:MAG: methionine aminotransferase [Cryomorphaceae bacterium]|nr:aminotransferase class I/II-fold pyridoxal phosphate-dependent enzyme [Flavobacteriales bacterium]